MTQFTPDPAHFYNPERGGFIETALDGTGGNYSWVKTNYSVNIVRANIRLDSWRTENIPQARLDAMDLLNREEPPTIEDNKPLAPAKSDG